MICDENRPHLCIGSCNHAICSICAVRMRFKNKDLKCTLCKQVNEMMVVCEDKSADNESNKANGKSSSSSSSSSFVRYEDFDLFGDSAAGGITLEEAKILFLDCKAHYETIKDLISFHCPHTSCANKVHRFNSIDALNQHLQCKHQRVLCKLCVTHRALFISEQTLFTSKELQRHIQSTDISPSSSSSSSSSSRHPLCQFCKENFYDAADLFQHMRQQHFSCRFCPIEFQHRYYRNPSSLNAHIASSHLTCPFQNCPEAHRAFDTQEDYATHMRLSHHSSSSGGGRRGRGGHQPVHLITEAHHHHHHHHHQSSSSGAHPSEGLQYLDLYAASPDPNIPSNERQSGYRPDGRASSSSASTSATSVQPVSNRVPLIPPNMRIAGRVRNGNFARDASDALLERAYSTAAEQSIGSNGNGRGKPASQLRRRTDDFPALASGDHKKIVEEKKTPSIHEEHPLSLVTKERRLKALEAYKLKKEVLKH